MGKGGGGKGGGGQGNEISSNPRFAGNSSLYQAGQGVANLASYEQSLTNPLASMANWASNIATGGNAVPLSYQSTQTSPYGLGVHDKGHNWAGYGGTANYGPASGGAYVAQGAPWMGAAGAGAAGAGGIPGYQSADPGAISNYNLSRQSENLGPLLSGQQAAMNAQGQIAAQGGGIEAQNFANAQGALANQPGALANQNTALGYQAADFARGDPSKMPGGVLPASGLYADQQALIDAQTKSGQQTLYQQLANEGLSSSTQGAMLGAEIGQEGAAQAGQLIQGNIGLAQAAQGLAQGWGTQAQGWGNEAQGWGTQALGWNQAGQNWQQLGMAQEAATFGMFQNISQQDLQTQTQMWNEAMQGQGQLGQYLNGILSTYGMTNQYINTSLSASQANNARFTGGGGGGGGGAGDIGGLIGSVGGLFASSAGGTSAAAGIGAAVTGLFSAF